MAVHLSNVPMPDNPQRPGLPGSCALPAPVTRLIGRDDAIAIGCNLLAESRLVTLTGPGGIGKTQLALAIAQRLVDRFPGGVAFVALATVSDPDLVVSTIASTLGIRGARSDPVDQQLKALLGNQQVLLLLDNAEHLLDAAPEIASLLATCPNLHIVVTSRSPLHLRGEQVFDIMPLETPPPTRAASLAELRRYAAIELFVTQARATDAQFALSDQNAATIAAICARLDGLPLAIELAAACVRVLSLEGILTRLNEQLALLTGGPRDQPARLQTMRGAIAWSYELLDSDQQTLFRRLAVFSGGWTLDAAAAVCQPHQDVLYAMAVLIDSSLVRRSADSTGEARYDTLEPIRQYALEQLAESGELDTVRSRHADAALTLAEEAAPELDRRDQTMWMLRLDREHDNFRAALTWLYDRRDVARGLRLVGALSWFWNIRGFFLEARTWCEAFLALPGADSRTVARARALGTLAYVAYFLGSYEQARIYGEEALAINDATGDRAGRARLLIPLLTAALEGGDAARHRQLSVELLHVARELGDQENFARALVQLGWRTLHDGDTRQAIKLCSEALHLARRLENRATIALALGALGDAYHRDGEFARAGAAYRESLAIYVDYNYARAIAVGLDRLASLACANAQWQRAA